MHGREKNFFSKTSQTLMKNRKEPTEAFGTAYGRKNTKKTRTKVS